MSDTSVSRSEVGSSAPRRGRAQPHVLPRSLVSFLTCFYLVFCLFSPCSALLVVIGLEKKFSEFWGRRDWAQFCRRLRVGALLPALGTPPRPGVNQPGARRGWERSCCAQQWSLFVLRVDFISNGSFLFIDHA